jgi:hypothetical protein
MIERIIIELVKNGAVIRVVNAPPKKSAGGEVPPEFVPETVTVVEGDMARVMSVLATLIAG